MGKQIISVPIYIKKADLSDKKNPDDGGYSKMAAAWYDAVLDANKRGWIKSPTQVDPNNFPGMR